MLLEPGPLRLVPDGELPRPRGLPVFEALATAEVSALDGAASRLGAQQSSMASASTPIDPIRTGSDVARAADELARQASDPLGSIPTISGNAGALEGELGALASEIASDLQQRVPDQPAIPPEQVLEDQNNPDFFPIVIGWYEQYLGRTPSQDELNAHFRNPGGLAGVLAVILNSDEYRARHGQDGNGGGRGNGGGGGNGGNGGGGGGGGGSTRELLERYMQENPNERDRIERFLRDNPDDYDRAPRALDLPGWDDFVRRHT